MGRSDQHRAAAARATWRRPNPAVLVTLAPALMAPVFAGPVPTLHLERIIRQMSELRKQEIFESFAVKFPLKRLTAVHFDEPDMRPSRVGRRRRSLTS